MYKYLFVLVACIQITTPLSHAMQQPHDTVGLENFGTSCYMNSSLQCLIRTRPLYDIISPLQSANALQCSYVTETPANQSFIRFAQENFQKNRQLIADFITLTQQFGNPPSPASGAKNPVITPTSFHDTMLPLFDFIRGQHEDASEFLNRFIDKLCSINSRIANQDDPLLIPNNCYDYSFFDRTQQSFILNKQIVDLLYGIIDSTTTVPCPTHDSVSSTTLDAFAITTLNFDKNTKLQNDFAELLNTITQYINSFQYTIDTTTLQDNLRASIAKVLTEVQKLPLSKKISVLETYLQNTQKNMPLAVTKEYLQEMQTNLNQHITTVFSTIEDFFTSYTMNESMDQKEPVECTKCSQKHLNGFKKISFEKIPNIFIVSLKRFQQSWDQTKGLIRSKIKTPVRFSPTLTIQPEWTTDTCPQRRADYRLYGLIMHSGELTGGHYTTYIQNDTNEWQYYNDDDVTKANPNLSDPRIYIAFYQRIEPGSMHPDPLPDEETDTPPSDTNATTERLNDLALNLRALQKNLQELASQLAILQLKINGEA